MTNLKEHEIFTYHGAIEISSEFFRDLKFMREGNMFAVLYPTIYSLTKKCENVINAEGLYIVKLTITKK